MTMVIGFTSMEPQKLVTKLHEHLIYEISLTVEVAKASVIVKAKPVGH